MSDIVPTLTAFVAERFEAPLHARLIVQPFIGVMLALIDGLSDADQHRPPFLWPGQHRPGQARSRRQVSVLRSLGKVLALALLLDVAHQYIALRHIDLSEALMIASVLALAPYAALRGLVTRFSAEPRDRRPSSTRTASLGYRGHGAASRPD